MEATGYALLALLKCGHVQEAAAPFEWLNQQRRAGGGFGSTQVSMANEFCLILVKHGGGGIVLWGFIFM